MRPVVLVAAVPLNKFVGIPLICGGVLVVYVVVPEIGFTENLLPYR